MRDTAVSQRTTNMVAHLGPRAGGSLPLRPKESQGGLPESASRPVRDEAGHGLHGRLGEVLQDDQAPRPKEAPPGERVQRAESQRASVRGIEKDEIEGRLAPGKRRQRGDGIARNDPGPFPGNAEDGKVGAEDAEGLAVALDEDGARRTAGERLDPDRAGPRRSGPAPTAWRACAGGASASS